MADEFQVCNENWWSIARSSAGFDGPVGMSSVASSISCSSATGHIGADGGYSWAAAEAVEGGTRSAGDEPVGSGSGSSVSYQDNHKVHVSDPLPPCVSFMDSSVQVPGFGLSSPMIDWNQALISGGGGRVEPSFHAMLQDQDLSSRPVYRQGIPIESVQHQGSTDESTASLFKEMNQGFLLEQHQEQGGNFSLVPTSYGYNTSTMAQGLYDQENKSSQQQSLYQSPMSFGSNELPQFLKSSTPKHPLSNQLHFSNNTPFWNASSGAAADVRPTFYSSMPTHFVQQALEQKPSCNNLSIKKNTEAVSSGAKKSSSEPAFKKPRVETPSPLPTFKVRKEKLGDRITALQQLVSPFGKTDTASVLHEAIEYIKFLHEQVGVLSTPYLKNNGNPMQHQQNNNEKHNKDGEGSKQDLRSRGLCLVPIASTFPVASETPADFWTPTFGGMYR